MCAVGIGAQVSVELGEVGVGLFRVEAASRRWRQKVSRAVLAAATHHDGRQYVHL